MGDSRDDIVILMSSISVLGKISVRVDHDGGTWDYVLSQVYLYALVLMTKYL